MSAHTSWDNPLKRHSMVDVSYPLCDIGDYCDICKRTIEYDGHSMSGHLIDRIEELSQEIRDLWNECDRAYEAGYIDGRGDKVAAYEEILARSNG